MNIRRILTALQGMLLLAAIIAAGPVLAQDEPDPVVESATPSSALQGTLDLPIEITGSYLGRGAEVSFHEPLDGDGFGPEITDIKVKKVRAKGTTRLIVTVDIGENAYVGDTDIQVSYTSQNTTRKGKGTTLFKVLEKDTSQPSDCMLDFDATFDDLYDTDPETAGWIDGVRSDNEYGENGDLVTEMDPYYAFGGTGMRLDTNGSQQLETSKDTRFLTIDFSRTSQGCSGGANDPAEAAGFCTSKKGVNMRFEHQVQVLEDNGLCLMVPKGATKDVTVVIKFEQSSGGTLTNEFKNGRQNGNGATAIVLNYGCQALNLLDDFNAEYQATVSRIDQFTWRVEGTTACMHTELGNKLKNADGSTAYLNMPFGLTLTDVNAPPGN